MLQPCVGGLPAADLAGDAGGREATTVSRMDICGAVALETREACLEPAAAGVPCPPTSFTAANM